MNKPFLQLHSSWCVFWLDTNPKELFFCLTNSGISTRTPWDYDWLFRNPVTGKRIEVSGDNVKLQEKWFYVECQEFCAYLIFDRPTTEKIMEGNRKHPSFRRGHDRLWRHQ